MTRKGRLCIVMDYCDGGDVHQEIKRQQKLGDLLPENKIVEWFAQTCFALKHVHERYPLIKVLAKPQTNVIVSHYAVTVCFMV